jgi:integrase
MKVPYAPISSAVTIGEIYEDCCKKAGLPVSKRFHNLRRSLATSMITNGVSVYEAAQAAGDKDIDSLKPYIGLDTAH